jgi:hypothetical protein
MHVEYVLAFTEASLSGYRFGDRVQFTGFWAGAAVSPRFAPNDEVDFGRIMSRLLAADTTPGQTCDDATVTRMLSGAGRGSRAGTFRAVSNLLINIRWPTENGNRTCPIPATPIHAGTMSCAVTASKRLAEPDSGRG